MPTSSADPFESRKRERMDEQGRDRERRSHYDDRDGKRRKTDSPALNGVGGHQGVHAGHQPRDGDPRMRRSTSPTAKKASSGMPATEADPSLHSNGPGTLLGATAGKIYPGGLDMNAPIWPYRGGGGRRPTEHRKGLPGVFTVTSSS